MNGLVVRYRSALVLVQAQHPTGAATDRHSTYRTRSGGIKDDTQYRTVRGSAGSIVRRILLEH